MKQNKKYIRTIINNEIRKKLIEPIIFLISFLFSVVMFFITTYKIRDLHINNLASVWFYITNTVFWIWLFYISIPASFRIWFFSQISTRKI